MELHRCSNLKLAGRLAIVVALAGTLAGCGDDDAGAPDGRPAAPDRSAPSGADGGSSAGAEADADAGRSGGSANQPRPGLEQPLFAECGVERFARPAVTPKVYDGGRGFEVVYQVPGEAGAAEDPDEALIVTLIERVPSGPRGDVEGGGEVRIAGREVSLARGEGGSTSHVVQWKTGEARYIALVGGDTLATVRDIVRCMP